MGPRAFLGAVVKREISSLFNRYIREDGITKFYPDMTPDLPK
jgi:hypothetical protein